METLSNGFRCPGGPIGVHPALSHPSDCRLYYVCLDGVTPSEAGCVTGKVFNPVTKQCDIPANVEGNIIYFYLFTMNERHCTTLTHSLLHVNGAKSQACR